MSNKTVRTRRSIPTNSFDRNKHPANFKPQNEPDVATDHSQKSSIVFEINNPPPQRQAAPNLHLKMRSPGSRIFIFIFAVCIFPATKLRQSTPCHVALMNGPPLFSVRILSFNPRYKLRPRRSKLRSNFWPGITKKWSARY